MTNVPQLKVEERISFKLSNLNAIPRWNRLLSGSVPLRN